MLSSIPALIICLSLAVGCAGNSPAQTNSSQSAAAQSESAALQPAEQSASAVAESESAQPVENVEIRAAWWGDTGRNDLYQQITGRFEADNPDVKVICEPVSWTDYWDKLAVQTSSNNAPDFMGMHPQYAADYIGRGKIEPLQQYIDSGALNMEGWPEGVINTGSVNGTLYMLAMGVTFSSVFVNDGLFEQLGVTKPGFDWNWDDMKTIGTDTRAKLDAAGMDSSWFMADLSNNLNSWRYFVRQNGHEIYTADGEIGFTLEDVTDWWTMYTEFRQLGIVPDAATTTEYSTATLEDSLFSRDKVLAILVPVNQFKLYSTTFPDKKLSIIRNPSAAGKAVGEFPEGAHFAISSASAPEKKAAAARLMNFWINSAASLELFGLDQGVPGNTSLSDSYMPNLDEYQLQIYDFVEKLSEIGTPSTFPAAGATEVDALFKSIAESISFEQTTVEDGAQQFFEQAKTIVADNKS
jgi:multiple sugar transport system substrate-binding protein